MMPFVWDENRELFIDTTSGEELSLDEAEELVDELIDEAFGDLDTLIDEFIGEDGKKPKRPRRWYQALVSLLSDLYLTLAALGIGGIAFLDSTLRGLMQDALSRQLGYLEDFAQQVIGGQLSTRAIRQRARMYVNSSRSSYWTSRDEFERRRGTVEEQWITRGDNHVCHPCNEAEDEGWQPIGTYAQPGSGIVRLSPTTMCLGLSACRCRKRYR